MGNIPIHQCNHGHADDALGDADPFSVWSPAAGSLRSFSAGSHPDTRPARQGAVAGSAVPGACHPSPQALPCQTLRQRPSSSLWDRTLSCQPGGAAAGLGKASMASRLGEVAGEAVSQQMQEGRGGAGPCARSATWSTQAGRANTAEQKRLHGPEKFGKRYPPSPFLSECLCLSFLNV